MILKILLPIILVILLTTFYLDRICWRQGCFWKRVLGWGVTLLTLCLSIVTGFTRDYFPNSFQLLFLYLDLLCVVIVPAAVFALCLFLGRCFKHQRWGQWMGVVLGLAVVLTYLYGMYVGSRSIEVKQVEYASKEVPAAFSGYKIVQISDAHVGSFVGSRKGMMKEAVDLVNAQAADLVVFTGDLQNKHAAEISEHSRLLSSIRARDGVVAVLGNHDYGEYLGGTESEKRGATALTDKAIRSLGWTLLRNEHLVLHRGKDSIVIAGMENDGEGRFPQLGDINKSLEGVGKGSFVIMLEHDPTSWRRKIVPDGRAHLTLSGHTHGGQMNILGWSPAAMVYSEYSGIYNIGPHTLYVSAGLSGVVPFRLGIPGEITVITLSAHAKQKSKV